MSTTTSSSDICNYENELDVKLVSAKLVEQLVLSLDAKVTSSHDVQLLVDTYT